MSDKRIVRTAARLIVLGALAFGATGCANGPLLGRSSALKQTDSFIQVTKKRSTWCYTRIVEQVPHDEICQRGDYVRYTDEPKANKIYRPIPEYVLALFDAMSDGEKSAHLTSYAP